LENSKFILIKKIEKKITSQIFVKDLYVINDRTLFGFHDVMKTPGSLDDLMKPGRRRKKVSGSLLSDESHEEYSYRLFKKGGRIIFKREEGRSDILNNWEKFFIVTGMVHKVIIEDGKFTFVYNSKKYSYDKEIGGIMYKDGMLVYYLRGENSILYFQSEYEKIYNIPKITAMNWDNEYITIGTGDGYAYLFNGFVLEGRKNICDVPITGIGFMNGYIYFSSLNGLVDRRNISSKYSILYLFITLIVLILAVVIGIFIRK